MNVTGSDKIEMFSKDGKYLLLIGDYHYDYRKDKCSYFKKSILIPEFIEQVITKNPEKIWDFYLEQGVIKRDGEASAAFLNHLNNTDIKGAYQEYRKYTSIFKKNEKSSLGLTNIYFQMKGCFSKDSSKCYIKNGRFHFIDIRQKYFNDCELGVVHYHRNFFENLFDAFDNEDFEKFIDDLIISYEHLLDSCLPDKTKVTKQVAQSIFSDKVNEFLKDKLDAVISLMKDILKILIDERQTILDLFKEDLELETTSAGDYIIEKCSEISNMNIFDRIDAIEKNFKSLRRFDFLWEVMFIFSIINMDMYALGRMTKAYNQNIIVFAGMNHIERYRDFFTNIGWEPVWLAKQVYKKCSQVPRDMFPELLKTVKLVNSVSVGKKSKSVRRKKRKSIKKKK